MSSKAVRIVICFILNAILIVIPGCVTQIKNSLPQNELAYYNDSYDTLREDLWDKAGHLTLEAQMENFKQADMRIENGKLIVQTKTGSFSKGGLGTKYTLGGNFDVQLDCHFDFLEHATDTDQLLQFLVTDSSKDTKDTDIVIIGMAKRAWSWQGYIYCDWKVHGAFKKGKRQKIDSLHGTLRVVRIGNEVSTLYKKMGQKKWEKLNTFSFTENNMLVGFRLQNHFLKRTSIQANDSIIAEFDNFKISAAHKIIEDEI